MYTEASKAGRLTWEQPENIDPGTMRYRFSCGDTYGQIVDFRFDSKCRSIQIDLAKVPVIYHQRVCELLITEVAPLWKRTGVRVVRVQNAENSCVQVGLNADAFVQSHGETCTLEFPVSDQRPFTGKAVKVISTYAGDFRHIQCEAKRPLKLWKQMWDIERSVVYGYPTDLVFVYNYPLAGELVKDLEYLRECENFLFSLDGQITRQGSVSVLQRPNIGISYGGFDYVFRTLRHRYDFWFFSEDDYLTVSDGIMADAICRLHAVWPDSLVGFVAIGGISHVVAPAVCGGCGVTTREILEQVCSHNIMDVHGCGCLPHTPSKQPGAAGHNTSAEVPFVNSICKLGYHLWDSGIVSPVMLWDEAASGIHRWTARLTTYDPALLKAFLTSRGV